MDVARHRDRRDVRRHRLLGRGPPARAHHDGPRGDPAAGPGPIRLSVASTALGATVTCNGWTDDTQPGDITGENVGGNWSAVGKDGKPLVAK